MATSKATRPRKPRPDFPLYAAANGQWAKTILGKRYHFGVWADPNGALQRYVDEKDDLLAGRKPRPRNGDYVSVADCCNAILNAKALEVEAGKRSQRTWDDLKSAADIVVAEFGRNRAVTDLHPDDFGKLRHKRGTRETRYGTKPKPKTIEGEVKNIRAIFNFAYKNDLIEHPVKFGTQFSLPDRAEYRKARAEVGERMFTPEELRMLIGSATPAMKALILLGVNTGIGNGDLKTMEFRHVDLESGWLDYPRRKTGMNRRAKLWDETSDAIIDYLQNRPEPSEQHKNIVFITRHGNTWGTLESVSCPIGHQFRKLLNRLGLYRRGKSFYTLRHVFETIGSGAKDQIALNYAMGHDSGHVANEYRERIEDERLAVIADHVHAWLFQSGGRAK